MPRNTKAKQTKPAGPAKSVHKRNTLKGRVIRRAVAMQSVADAVGPIEPGCEIFGVTKGQWSLVDLLEHCLAATGPADVVISTWTAASADITFAMGFLGDGRLKSLRFLVDFSFPSRQPAYCQALREAFGDEAIRITKNHAKFVLMRNERWNLVVRTSMNLNENRRLESFEVSDDAGMAGFLADLVDELFGDQTPKDTWERTPYEQCEAFEGQWGESTEGLASSGQRQFFGDGPFDVDLRRIGATYRGGIE